MNCMEIWTRNTQTQIIISIVQERRNSIANALNGLEQEICNFIANALELRLSFTTPSVFHK